MLRPTPAAIFHISLKFSHAKVAERIRSELHCLLLCAASLSPVASAQTDIPLTQEQQEQVYTITSGINAVDTPAFKVLKENEARQAAAAARYASGSPGSYNADLMRSGVVEQYAQASQSANKEIVHGIGAEQIQRAMAMLPSMGQLGSDIKYGKFVVVSDKGEEIITLIRSLAARNEAERATILRKIVNFSDRGYPEAVNFMGIIFEYGLFGATIDMDRAVAFYMTAAKRHYQPAIYNLANSDFYGKNGQRQVDEAERLIAQAYALGNEPSFRVCGLGAFMKYRKRKQSEALAYGRACFSALANLPNAVQANRNNMTERIKMLRDSIATGANDGFNVLEQIAQPTIGDKDYLYCKYRLINRIRFTGDVKNLRELAKDCYQKTARNLNSPDEKIHAQMALAGIIGFVPVEINELKHLRETNHFHYAWSVPYLPFNQNEVDLFEPLMPKGKK